MSAYQSECPVCYSFCTNNVDYEGYIVCEEYTECPKCCYHYEFSYGSHAVHFLIHEQHVVFYWDYHDTDPVEVRARQEAIEIVTLAARKAFGELGLNSERRC